MAAPTFSINGGSAIPGVIAAWQRIPKRKNSDGSIDWQPWALHVWDMPWMTITRFEALQALAGKALTSLATTNINDVNNGATYTGAEIVGPVTCGHLGVRAENVRIEFRVDV